MKTKLSLLLKLRIEVGATKTANDRTRRCRIIGRIAKVLFYFMKIRNVTSDFLEKSAVQIKLKGHPAHAEYHLVLLFQFTDSTNIYKSAHFDKKGGIRVTADDRMISLKDTKRKTNIKWKKVRWGNS